MGGGEIQVPTAISGVITRAPEISFCMDGATHLIHSALGATRLKGANPAVTRRLEEHADGKTRVTVMGYPVWGPECMHYSIYSVSPMEEFAKRLLAASKAS